MTTVYNCITRFMAFVIGFWGIAAHGQYTPVPLTYSVSLVKDIRPGGESSYTGRDMAAIGNTLYFVADVPAYGMEVWKTTGSAASTVLLRDINPNGSSSPLSLTAVNETLFFVATGPSGRELYKSNGTAAGTVLVKNIHPWGDANPVCLFNYNGTLLFFADNGASGTELWKSDGTAAGTVLVKDINQNGSSLPGGFNGKMAELNGIAYFIANDGLNGEELWRTDGTTAGTYLVRNIHPTGPAGIADLAVAGGILFFIADDGVHGKELWKSDGTRAGTMMVKDLQQDGGIIQSSLITPVGSQVLFSASVNGDFELYKSDGTANGTFRVKNINSQTRSDPRFLTRVGSLVYFTANDGIHGRELWKSDGTAAGTVMVKDFTPGAGDSRINELTGIGARLFFTLNEDEPYVSNGTAEGTLRLANINPSGPAVTRQFTGVGNAVYFFAGNPVTGRELYRAVPCTYCPVAATSFARFAADEDDAPLDVVILPNPVRTTLTVDVKGSAGAPLQVELYNARGLPVEKRYISHPGETEKQEFGVANQPPGILVLRVTSGQETKAVQVIKVD